MLLRVIRGSIAVLCLLPLLATAAQRVKLDYEVRFVPDSDLAEVSLTLARGQAVRYIDFNLGLADDYRDFQADGQWLEDQPGRGLWRPAEGRAQLRYRVRVSRERSNGRFDARMTPEWALLRGDDLVPPARVDVEPNVELVSRLQFDLPEGWTAVETGWPRIGKQRFRIDNPAQRFDRPTGWILAGKLGVRRATLGSTEVTVAAPVGEGMRRMDILTLLTFVWPHAQSLFPREPGKLLIVGAGNPMWRGGLSAPNSLFMHADRPLVSENGTSSLLHELVHVFSRIRDSERSDWISEGLAEYYAIELMRRAGGMSEARYRKVREQLSRWGRKVTSLRGERVSGPVTARAVILLQDLDSEIRRVTANARSLDDVTRGLMRLEQVTTRDFVQISENVLGRSSRVLEGRLLK
ncbi:hypothetical protein [Pseudomonas sp. NW5]|uniref:hypothetical protein n=1 Tax=Pseudomonas sp. NW5 TaxID=2934934 RepID=UPI00202069A8|nr:hypothetical protein [Pseudomonas sp. NW5]MCL7462623.1 hypothetical protein [Pseudomonas sp. NW5]